jgi:putative sterol carrier protein
MAAPNIDPSAVDPQQFAQAIAATPDEQLAEGMRGAGREQVLDEIFRRMKDYAVAEQIAGVDALIHFEIGGRADGGSDLYEVAIRSGEIAINRQASGAPRMTLAIDAVDFLKLASGNAAGPELFMTGKLRVSGDLMFATQVASFFTPPKTA